MVDRLPTTARRAPLQVAELLRQARQVQQLNLRAIQIAGDPEFSERLTRELTCVAIATNAADG